VKEIKGESTFFLKLCNVIIKAPLFKSGIEYQLHNFPKGTKLGKIILHSQNIVRTGLQPISSPRRILSALDCNNREVKMQTVTGNG